VYSPASASAPAHLNLANQKVLNPEDAVVKVLDYMRATSLIAQTTLRSVLGQSNLDELLTSRDRVN
jgi:regulator of protease activity HflC (stomatin/prohibitin superfamily)